MSIDGNHHMFVLYYHDAKIAIDNLCTLRTIPNMEGVSWSCVFVFMVFMASESQQISMDA